MRGAPTTYQGVPSLFDENAIATPQRLSRLLDNSEESLADRKGATITILRHGGSNPVLINRGQRHSRFFFMSRKAGEVQFTEGLAEEYFAKLQEIDGTVVDFLCHHIVLTFLLHGKKRIYKSDLSRAVIDRHDRLVPELIEIKRYAGDLRDDDYKEKLAAVREICRTIGWRFRVMARKDVFPTKYMQRNVEALFGRRNAKLNAEELLIVQEIMNAGLPIHWGELSRSVSPRDVRHGDAVVETLIARGCFLTDFRKHFNERTKLRPNASRPSPSPIRI